MRCLEALLRGIGEGEVGKVLVGAILEILQVLAESLLSEGSATSHKFRHGLLQLLHIDVVALPFLHIRLFLDLGRPRATGDYCRRHLKGAIQTECCEEMVIGGGCRIQKLFHVQSFRGPCAGRGDLPLAGRATSINRNLGTIKHSRPHHLTTSDPLPPLQPHQHWQQAWETTSTSTPSSKRPARSSTRCVPPLPRPILTEHS